MSDPAVVVPAPALAALSAAALLLILDHRRANLGWRATAAFAAAATIYGLARSVVVHGISEAHLGGAPYRLTAPLLTIAGVPAQELAGWTIVAGLSSYFADRVLRVLRLPTDPYRTALAAAVLIAPLCLAVETAAVLGGWWSWSLADNDNGPLVFPAIAIIDWGFIAFDFILPFELWRRRRSTPLLPRLLSLAIFPLHMVGHLSTSRSALVLSGFDLAHIGIPAALLAATTMSREQSPWPALGREQLRTFPAVATAILLATTTSQVLLSRGPLWAGLPLAAVAAGVVLLRHDSPPAQRPEWPASRAGAVFLLVVAVGAALRLPSALAARSFEAHIREAAAALATGSPDQAQPALERAFELRPHHSEVLLLSGWAAMQRGDTEAARRHLEAARRRRPDSAEISALLRSLPAPAAISASAPAVPEPPPSPVREADRLR